MSRSLLSRILDTVLVMLAGVGAATCPHPASVTSQWNQDNDVPVPFEES